MNGGSIPSVSNYVRTSIKREGKFDAIRKQELAVLENSDIMNVLKNDIERLVNELIKDMPANKQREQVQNKLRESLRTPRFEAPIKNSVHSHVHSGAIQNDLEEDLRNKIREIYGLPPSSDQESDNNKQEEDVDIMTV
ncbi:unnamed protein product [Auanema sp. JU1783]|nr:unnamed protein product [Auanema sp. JU1783]